MAKNIILQKPIITEKSMDAVTENKYIFKVSSFSSKPEIKKTIEKTFKVKVIKVNIIHCQGKERRRGRTQGKTASWKKAIVTLKKGDKIELFEGI